MGWYDRTGRELPWRETTDRWPILVSEVMLQQTQVARVEPVFRTFIDAFPTPSALAAASFSEVVRSWGDLGYLRRARHLHESARQIAETGWPADLTDLPGVGPYTAAAVSAFADGRPVAAVDVNIRRVLSRWTGTILSPAAAGEVGSGLLAADRPGDWNQAMMDLGARLCRPRTPRCDECPVVDWCSDPSLELVTSRQSTFEGSVRQARAAVVKHLAARDDTLEEIIAATGLKTETVREAVEALLSEGTVVLDGEGLRLG